MTTTNRLPVPGFRSEMRDIGGAQLHTWIGGDPQGPPVVLWHGFLSTSYAWHKVAPRLAEAGLSVLVPDLLGFGDSAKPEGVNGYDARALAEQTRKLALALDFGKGKPLVLAAHDMGAPPALLWAADHPAEIASLLYIEAPVMLSSILQGVFAYTPEAMKEGSMWWWILPLAPGVAECLVVGHERAFLEWFYEKATMTRSSIDAGTVDEYLRTFAGREGVLGAMGVYRAAFTSIEQTEPLTKAKIRQPVVAIGGVKGLGAKVGTMVKLVAENVEAVTLESCGHFVPEESPDEIVQRVLKIVRKTQR
jgi:pimeloyl-ACP methyl ester carboxylesterase